MVRLGLDSGQVRVRVTVRVRLVLRSSHGWARRALGSGKVKVRSVRVGSHYGQLRSD